MGQAANTDNIVSFPKSEDGNGTDRSDAKLTETETDILEFGPIGDDWDSISTAQQVGRLFDSYMASDQSVRIGPFIERVRKLQGRSVEDIARELKFDETFIVGIETMDLSAMTKGFRAPRILTYARVLGLPGEEVLNLYRGQSEYLDGTKVRPETQLTIDPEKLERPTWIRPAAIASGLPDKVPA